MLKIAKPLLLTLTKKNEHGLLLEGGLKLSPTTQSKSRLGMEISYGTKLWESIQKDNDWQVSIGLSYQFE